jgi:hypothetical protein
VSAEGIGDAGLEDSSGASESSEGIIDHDQFNKGKKIARPDDLLRIADPFPQRTESNMSQAAKKALQKEMPPADTISPRVRRKQIIYSDKSDSSIEEMMGDTPSNYNMQNGRLDGKSLGLKAILMQAQKQMGVQISRSPRVDDSGFDVGGNRKGNEAEE